MCSPASWISRAIKFHIRVGRPTICCAFRLLRNGYHVTINIYPVHQEGALHHIESDIAGINSRVRYAEYCIYMVSSKKTVCRVQTKPERSFHRQWPMRTLPLISSATWCCTVLKGKASATQGHEHKKARREETRVRELRCSSVIPVVEVL